VLSEIVNGAWSKDYIYLGGQLLATEHTTQATRYHFADHLGTPRLVVNDAGGIICNHDYYPFGQERTVCSDGETHKFTGQERDAESTTDYFRARQYAYTLGRFLQPDEFTDGPVELFAEIAAANPTFYANPLNPQSLNKYAYVYNNPLRYVDPTGHVAGPPMPSHPCCQMLPGYGWINSPANNFPTLGSELGFRNVTYYMVNAEVSQPASAVREAAGKRGPALARKGQLVLVWVGADPTQHLYGWAVYWKVKEYHGENPNDVTPKDVAPAGTSDMNKVIRQYEKVIGTDTSYHRKGDPMKGVLTDRVSYLPAGREIYQHYTLDGKPASLVVFTSAGRWVVAPGVRVTVTKDFQIRFDALFDNQIPK
jgi:RHS repeat-associated protein